jgi:hypothetical protein
MARSQRFPLVIPIYRLNPKKLGLIESIPRIPWPSNHLITVSDFPTGLWLVKDYSKGSSIKDNTIQACQVKQILFSGIVGTLRLMTAKPTSKADKRPPDHVFGGV